LLSFIDDKAGDRGIMDRRCRNDKVAMRSYTDEVIYRDAGQGGCTVIIAPCPTLRQACAGAGDRSREANANNNRRHM
jgi:hypothetical protein